MHGKTILARGTGVLACRTSTGRNAGPTRLVAATLLLLALAAAAQATTLARMNLDELTAASGAIVRVRCLGGETRFEDGEIWTLTTFEVMETLKGATPSTITVRLIGGRWRNLISTVDGVPRFRPGEETYLFLESRPNGEFAVTSWVQGTFRIRRDPRTGVERVTQDTSGVVTFDPATRRFRPGEVRNLPIQEFRERVRAASERGVR